MREFLEVILSYPTVPLTIGLGIVVCYWLFVVVGAVGVDLLDGAAEGGVKGAAEGITSALKGSGDAVAGALKGSADSVTAVLKGSGEAAASALKGAGESAGASADGLEVTASSGGAELSTGASLLAWLGLGKVPVTIAGSTVTLSSWFLCTLASSKLLPVLSNEPGLLLRTLVLAGSLMMGTVLASLVLRPLHSVFADHRVMRRGDLRGRVCTVSSGKVDARFGTATLEDGGAGLILHVVCTKENALKKGERALIVDYDPATETYEVEPIDWLSPEELRDLDHPSRATSVARRLRSR